MIHQKFTHDLALFILLLSLFQIKILAENRFFSQRGLSKISIPKLKLDGKRFVYSLGCHWESQFYTKGMLNFYTPGKFRFEMSKAIHKRHHDEAPANYFEYDFKDEILEGSYSYQAEKKEITFLVEKYQLGYKASAYDHAVLGDSSLIYDKLIARLDSCEDKLRLVFLSDFEEVLPEKYYEWLEQDYSGSYISYAQGFREEIRIQEKKQKKLVFYQSSKYSKPIALPLINQDTNSLRVHFPDKPEIIYHLDLNENFLWSSRQIADKSIRQRFMKIREVSSDNPRDLSLKVLLQSDDEYPSFEASPRLDTTVSFAENKKIVFSNASVEEFKACYKEIAYEQALKSKCYVLRGIEEEYYPCLQQLEDSLLEKNPMAKREDDLLIFQIQGKAPRFLRNNFTALPDTREFWYQGTQQTPNGLVSIVLGYFYEWRSYKLLHHPSGEEIDVTGIPYFSPDGKYFIVYDNKELSTAEGVFIQLWEVKPYGFDLIWQFEPNYIPQNFAWMNQNKIVFNVVDFTKEQGRAIAYGKMEIIE